MCGVISDHKLVRSDAEFGCLCGGRMIQAGELHVIIVNVLRTLCAQDGDAIFVSHDDSM